MSSTLTEASATRPGLHPALKLVAFVVTVVIGGALLAPPLYYAAQWGLRVGFLPDALAGFKFPKYVTRAMLVVALALIWPLVKWLGISSRAELGLERDPRWAIRFGLGLAKGALGLALVGVLLVALGFATWRAPLPWHRLLEAAATGITVAVIEEWTFRGIIFGLVRRSQPWPKALVIVSLVFAVLHFVRAPLVAPQVEEIHWWSGLALVPAHFWQFGEPVLLIGSLPTYFLVGATLAYTVVQTKSLAFAIGLHAGWVFALRGFGFLSRRVGEPTVWLGRDLISGIIPALLVALTWFLLVLMFRRRRI